MRAVVRAVRGLIVLAVVLVGVPWSLVRFVGNPLPSSVPHLGGIVGSIERSGVDPAVVVNGLAILVWLAWARLAVAVVVELVARARRRPAPSLPGLGSAQRWAASLLASITLVGVGLGQVRGAGAFESAPRPVPAVTLGWSGGALGSDGSEFDDPAPAPPAVPVLPSAVPAAAGRAPTTWTVERNDSWWRIAETALGDGMRWQEVRDANLGREVAPGVVFGPATAVLHPGWVLALPGPAGGPAPAPTPPTSTIAVGAGDTLSSLAERHLGDDSAWPELWEANRDRTFPDGRRFTDPDLLRPGWVLSLPGAVESAAPVRSLLSRAPSVVSAPGPEPAPAPVPAAAPVCEPAATTAPAQTPASPVDTFGTQTERDATVPLGLASATLLATAGLGLVRFRRRQQLRGATLDTRPPAPDPALIRLEQRLVAVSAQELVARVDLAVRGAVAELRRRAGEGVAPAPLLVVVSSDEGEIELVFDGPPVAPIEPFIASPRGWTLPAGIPTSAIPAGNRFAPFPCPTLVQIGRVEGRDLYLDLEAGGTLGIEGSRRHARTVMNQILATLSAGAFGEPCRIVTTGLDPQTIVVRTGTECLANLDDAIERATELVTPVLDVLRPGQTTAALRSGSAGEPWEAVVLAAGAERVVGEAGAELPALGATPGRGLAIVTDAPGARTRWKLRQLDSTWRLDPLGIDIRPVGVTTDELDGIGRLVAAASGPLESEPRPAAPPRSCAMTDWALMVRTFGRPRITTRSGAEIEFARTKALELVVWLARHRSTATRSGARAALWDVEVANGTFANVVSDARHSLAAAVDAPDGELWLGRSVSERLELHRGVVTDVDLLEAALRRARSEPAPQARATLTEALDLVAGVPFTAAPFLWPDAEGLVSTDTLLATTVAAELAELCLAAGDLDGVFAATGVGLLVLPGHEELLALRMRAQAARGDLASVKREWEGYERVIAGDPLGDGEPSARLVQLRNDLLGSRRR